MQYGPLSIFVDNDLTVMVIADANTFPRLHQSINQSTLGD